MTQLEALKQNLVLVLDEGFKLYFEDEDLCISKENAKGVFKIKNYAVVCFIDNLLSWKEDEKCPIRLKILKMTDIISVIKGLEVANTEHCIQTSNKNERYYGLYEGDIKYGYVDLP